MDILLREIDFTYNFWKKFNGEKCFKTSNGKNTINVTTNSIILLIIKLMFSTSQQFLISKRIMYFTFINCFFRKCNAKTLLH